MSHETRVPEMRRNETTGLMEWTGRMVTVNASGDVIFPLDTQADDGLPEKNASNDSGGSLSIEGGFGSSLIPDGGYEAVTTPPPKIAEPANPSIPLLDDLRDRLAQPE